MPNGDWKRRLYCSCLSDVVFILVAVSLDGLIGDLSRQTLLCSPQATIHAPLRSAQSGLKLHQCSVSCASIRLFVSTLSPSFFYPSRPSIVHPLHPSWWSPHPPPLLLTAASPPGLHSLIDRRRLWWSAGTDSGVSIYNVPPSPQRKGTHAHAHAWALYI